MENVENPPLKRHDSLQPFSCDHFIGLRVANRLVNVADGALEAAAQAFSYFVKCWDAEIAAHFNEEEALLTPLMTDTEIDQMRREHADYPGREGRRCARRRRNVR